MSGLAAKGQAPADAGKSANRPRPTEPASEKDVNPLWSRLATLGAPAVTLQPKLTISPPDDPYEREADRVAEQVMRMPDPGGGEEEEELRRRPLEEDQEEQEHLQRQPVGKETSEEKLRRLPVDEGETLRFQQVGRDGAVPPRIETRIRSLQNGGSRLPERVREDMESRFATPFNDVRIHTGASASEMTGSLQARAFTVGSNVFFAHGQFSPESSSGRRLLAHELTHVIQQGHATPWTSRRPRLGRALARVQRDATDQCILPAYAQSLDDEQLLTELGLVESLLAGQTASSERSSTLGSNLRTLQEELDFRQRSFSSPVAEPSSAPVRRGPAGSPGIPQIPEGGERVDRVGIVNWDREPPLRLRSEPDTTGDNIITTLPFNTAVQVIKQFTNGWLFVATPSGDLGYVASDYVWMDLPEPNARLHRVESGIPGTAIAIAERYYGQYADDWGQDLRFYVNVLAWANKINVPNTTSGWRQVHFQAGRFIWIPSYPFARSLRGLVNSGSISYNFADALGLATFIERIGELWDDFRTAISLSGQYMGEAIARHAEKALYNVLYSLAIMLVAAILILAISTAIGAAIGALAGGVGAVPGAAAGFEVGMVILDWLGLAMLLVWIGQAIWETAAAFGTFLGTVWNARGNQETLDRAARELAEAVGIFLGNLLEAIVLYAASKGLNEGLGLLRNSKVGQSMGEHRAGEWLNERVRRVRAGETPIVGPRRALARFYRGVEIVDANGSPLGEFDGVDMSQKIFVENKSASGLRRVNPRTGRPQQTPAQWARKQVFKKTDTRINNLASAGSSRPTPGGSANVPTLAELRGIKHIHFVIDASNPALRAAVHAEIANLRAAHPSWTFTAEFGLSVNLRPVPDQGPESPEGD